MKKPTTLTPKDPLDDLEVEGIPVGKVIKGAKAAKSVLGGIRALRGLLRK